MFVCSFIAFCLLFCYFCCTFMYKLRLPTVCVSVEAIIVIDMMCKLRLSVNYQALIIDLLSIYMYPYTCYIHIYWSVMLKLWVTSSLGRFIAYLISDSVYVYTGFQRLFDSLQTPWKPSLPKTSLKAPWIL